MRSDAHAGRGGRHKGGQAGHCCGMCTGPRPADTRMYTTPAWPSSQSRGGIAHTRCPGGLEPAAFGESESTLPPKTHSAPQNAPRTDSLTGKSKKDSKPLQGIRALASSLATSALGRRSTIPERSFADLHRKHRSRRVGIRVNVNDPAAQPV